MNLSVKRFEHSRDGKATIGRWFVDGEYVCFNLEDAVREPADGRPPAASMMESWVKTWKIPGITAIPTGIYRVIIDRSPLFSQRASTRSRIHIDIYTPHVLDIPAYSGIRIHPGVKAEDTEGCLCPGFIHDAGSSTVSDSRKALTCLLAKIEFALGLERIPTPNSRVAEYLKHWAFAYKEARKPDDVWLTVTNEFFGFPLSASGVDGIDL